MYTEFEQAIFNRALQNYKSKHGDHPSGYDIFYRTEIYKTIMCDEFWDTYFNTKEELL